MTRSSTITTMTTILRFKCAISSRAIEERAIADESERLALISIQSTMH